MNNNTKHNRARALKNYHGNAKQESTDFVIPVVTNNQRHNYTSRVQTIRIGTLPRIKRHAKVARKA